MSAAADSAGLCDSAPASWRLPRLVWRSSDSVSRLARLAVAGGVAAAVFAVVGLPHLSLMHPWYAIGVVTPSCGLTRSAVAIAGGQFALAWQFNPAGFLVVAGAAGIIGRWIVGRLTGRWLGVVVPGRRLRTAIAAIAVAALWLNQQAHAAFIIEGRL